MCAGGLTATRASLATVVGACPVSFVGEPGRKVRVAEQKQARGITRARAAHAGHACHARPHTGHALMLGFFFSSASRRRRVCCLRFWRLSFSFFS